VYSDNCDAPFKALYDCHVLNYSKGASGLSVNTPECVSSRQK